MCCREHRYVSGVCDAIVQRQKSCGCGEVEGVHVGINQVQKVLDCMKNTLTFDPYRCFPSPFSLLLHRLSILPTCHHQTMSPLLCLLIILSIAISSAFHAPSIVSVPRSGRVLSSKPISLGSTSESGAELISRTKAEIESSM